MPDRYRLKDNSSVYPLLNYRYKGKLMTYHALKNIEESGSCYLKTEHDVITKWAEFSKQALEGKYAESKVKCWIGHYEQFGVVMLNYGKMCRYRKNYKGNWDEFLESALPTDCYDQVFTGPTGSADSTFYRVWFTLLGHPDFLANSLIGAEVLTQKINELSLTIAFDDLNRSLLKKN